MRDMFDAVNARNIPQDAPMVAGYADTITIPQWTDADWALFPKAVKVRIVKKASTNDGHVLDVENGDARPDEAPGWVTMRRNSGATPTVYCNLSTWAEVRDAFRNAGVPEPYYWIARYDGVYGIPDTWLQAGCVAKQYYSGAYVDLSVVLDYWPGVDPYFVPGKDDDMTVNAIATATEQMVPIRCSGARQLFILTGGSNVVKGHVYCIGDTPGGPASNKSYMGDFAVNIDPDRPGPIPIPPNTRGLTLWFTGNGPFAAWCE